MALPIAEFKILGSTDSVTVIIGMAKQSTANILGTSKSIDGGFFTFKKTPNMIASDLGDHF